MTGSKLRTIRQRLGLTQAQLGIALQRDSTTISRWELGALAIDRPQDLAFLLAHLEASILTIQQEPYDWDEWLADWLDRSTSHTLAAIA